MNYIGFSLCLIVLKCIPQSLEHGYLLEPPARNSMWRVGFPTPPNYGDNELFCGGIAVQWNQNGGKCGICGDPYDKERKHETGGFFARNITTRNYTPGSVIDVMIEMVANHGGNFTFSICWRNTFDEKETENCFEDLKTLKGSKSWKLDNNKRGIVGVSLQLPPERTCDKCVFRWHWKSANNWGVCEDGTAATGCGPQEVYRNCADIAVGHEYGIRGPIGSNRIEDEKHWRRGGHHF